MKFKEGDRIKVVKINADDVSDYGDAIEKLIGKTGTVDEVLKGAMYPYGIKYDSDELMDKVVIEEFFPRFFKEEELELVEIDDFEMDEKFTIVLDKDGLSFRPSYENPKIENVFMYHSPKEGQPEKYNELREKAKELAYLIDGLCPDSREKSLAMTKLEEAVFWANASIARN